MTYVLDALDRTVSRTEGGTTTFDYVGTAEDPAKVTEGAAETSYGWSPSGPVAQKSDSAVRFLIRDLHQDVVALVDPAGTSSGSKAYSPWGEIRSGSGDSTRLGYQSDLTDPRTGLVDMLTRQYAPGLGRFTTRDSLFGELLEPSTLNQYAYTSGSPIRFSDLTGMGQIDENGNNYGTSTSRRKLKRSSSGGSATGGGTTREYDPTPTLPNPAPAAVRRAELLKHVTKFLVKIASCGANPWADELAADTPCLFSAQVPRLIPGCSCTTIDTAVLLTKERGGGKGNRRRVEDAVRKVLGRGWESLKQFLSAKELAAMERELRLNQQLGKRFGGQAVHRAVFRELQAEGVDYGSRGIDYRFPSGRPVELTTSRQLTAHELRYGSAADYTTYDLP